MPFSTRASKKGKYARRSKRPPVKRVALFNGQRPLNKGGTKVLMVSFCDLVQSTGVSKQRTKYQLTVHYLFLPCWHKGGNHQETVAGYAILIEQISPVFTFTSTPHAFPWPVQRGMQYLLHTSSMVSVVFRNLLCPMPSRKGQTMRRSFGRL